MNFLFENNSLRDVNGEFLYEHLYQKIPSIHSFNDVNVEKTFKFLNENYKLVAQLTSDYNTEHNSFLMHTLIGKDAFKMDDESQNLFFFQNGEVLIRLNHFGKSGYMSVYCHDVEALRIIVPKLQVFVEKKEKNSEIGVLISVNGSIQIKKIPLDVADLDVSSNYGNEFSKIKHDLIVKKLNEERSGLYLFYGEAGTGKTNYIKYLSKLIDRDFIFVPTNMIDSLVSPDLIQTLIHHENLVLILEDAEKAVVNREENHNEALVSTILNLTDGLIGNLFNVSILVTFNTSKERIDKALYRKGRLKIEHDFKPLDEKDAQNLIDKLGKTHKVRRPMTLAEIYNVEEDNFHKEPEKKSLGFQIV